MPPERIYYVDYDFTAYGCAFGLLRIGTGVYPAKERLRGANSNISMHGAVAHEIIGHRNAALAGILKVMMFLKKFRQVSEPADLLGA